MHKEEEYQRRRRMLRTTTTPHFKFVPLADQPYFSSSPKDLSTKASTPTTLPSDYLLQYDVFKKSAINMQG